MKIDARTCSKEERNKYTATINGQPPCFVIAADEEEGWIEILVRRDATLTGYPSVVVIDGELLTARIYGNVKIEEIDVVKARYGVPLKKTESSSDDLTE